MVIFSIIYEINKYFTAEVNSISQKQLDFASHFDICVTFAGMILDGQLPKSQLTTNVNQSLLAILCFG